VHDGAPVVVFAGGGTGGHLYPALALADALVFQRPEVRPFFVGAVGGVEARILPQRGVEHALLPVEGFARGSGVRGLRAVPRLGVSLVTVADLFQRLRPDAVVVTGGYAAAPAGIVAGVARIPLLLQEQNAMPGITTRLLSRWADVVHVAFPEAAARLPARARSRVRLSGNPVRPALTMTASDARRALGLPLDGAVLLAFGGSQGSAALNGLLVEACVAVRAGSLVLPAGLHVLWATGPKHHAAVTARLGEAGTPEWLTVVPYLDEMPVALAAADVAIARSGAMSTAELLVNGVPAILVPLPTAAADHQTYNARALAEAGAAVVLEEAGLTAAGLWHELSSLLADAPRMRQMSERALQRAVPDSASIIARDVVDLLFGVEA